MPGSQFAELSAFMAVAEDASFTKAARRLGLATPTLSTMVRRFEERLGLRLFNRSTRSVALTPAGELLLRQVRPVLAGFDSAIESLNAVREHPAGHLRLAVAPPVARYLIAPLLAGFMARHPGITFDVCVENGFPDIIGGHFDAAFQRSDLVPHGMIGLPVSDGIRYFTVASPDYLARHGTPQTPADLHRHNCIRLRLLGGSYLPWRYVVDGSPLEVAVEGTAIANDRALATALAAGGAGITYLVEEYVAEMVADGRLVSLLYDFSVPTSGILMFYPSRSQNSAAFASFIEFMRRHRRRMGLAGPEHEREP